MSRLDLKTTAVVLEKPEHLVMSEIALPTPGEDDVIVDVAASGISTGTERLLWTGKMPMFPGMGYPLVPGYEAIGTVREAGRSSGLKVGQSVFVPGAKCFGEIRGLFGGSASRLVVPGSRVWALDSTLGDRGVMMALAATAYHAIAAPNALTPDLIIGHGVLGRLIARLAVIMGDTPPVVWETAAARRAGGEAYGYAVVDPSDDARRDYKAIYDVSGDANLLDTLVQRLAPGGEIVLAGFYSQPLSFSFPPAFMREARFRIAAEWREADMAATRALVESGRLSLDDLITHRSAANDAALAYRKAFEDVSCLKMILDWRSLS